MALSDFVSSRLSRPAGRVLDGPIRDIVQQVLRESGYASPAEVQALRDDARDLRSRLDAVDRRASDLVRSLEESRAEVARLRAAPADDTVEQRVAARVDALRAAQTLELEQLRAEIAALRAAPAAAPVAAAHAPTAAAEAPVTAAPRGACKVDGCDEVVRSKGFCSAHYQQWRRGTLRGFVALDGTATLADGSSVTVPASYAGSAVSRGAGGKLVVDGKAIA
jgi:hypothetical protein